MNKTLLLASFVKKDNVDWFKNHLKRNFNISSEKLFYFDIVEDDKKIIITFKIEVQIGERLDIKKHFKNTIPIHKKGPTLYTINALNKLIEKECNLEDAGNIDHKNHKIMWSQYEDIFILNNANELVLMPIKRAFY